MLMVLEHRAQREGRLSGFLRGEMAMSTGLMNRLKRSNGILVNGNPEFTNYHVLPGDVITAVLDDPLPEYPPEDMELDIRFEDEHLLVIDKPAGMLIHPSAHRLTGTLANGVLAYYQKTGQSCAFHPATRLDRDTFGLVLLAKNAHVHSKLNDLHSAGALQKTYRALVFGSMPEPRGTLDAPILRLPKPSLLRTVAPEGQPSKTGWNTLEQGENWSILDLKPYTGRTHQLRVHCAYLGCPILGDPQYGTEESLELSRHLGLPFQQLCARELDFVHPMTGKEMHLVSGMETFHPNHT